MSTVSDIRPPRIWPVDRLTALFFLISATITAAYFGRVERAPLFLAMNAVVLATLGLLVYATPRLSDRAAALWRLLHGCIATPLVFTQTGFLVKGVRGDEFASTLERADRLLFFGTNPLEAIEGISSPVLTEVMQWAYTSYLLLPPAVVILLALKASPYQTGRSCFALVGVMYLSYFGYFLVPASGPNLHNNLGPLKSVIDAYPYPLLPHLYTFSSDLPGVWLTHEMRSWMFDVETTKQDCFPSGHTAVAVTGWILARRLGRSYGRWFAFFAVGITLSTVYLRYHYVVDVIVGVGLAWFAAGPFLKLHDRWYGDGAAAPAAR